jgi:hypothetical protein
MRVCAGAVENETCRFALECEALGAKRDIVQPMA